MNEACNKVVLARNEGCRVIFCERHQVAEVEIGAISLRLDIEALNTLNELLMDATQNIATLQNVKIQHQQLMHKIKHM